VAQLSVNKSSRDTHLGFEFCFERFPPLLLLFPTFDFRVSVFTLFQKFLGLKAELRLPILVFPAAAAQGRGRMREQRQTHRFACSSSRLRSRHDLRSVSFSALTWEASGIRWRYNNNTDRQRPLGQSDAEKHASKAQRKKKVTKSRRTRAQDSLSSMS